MRDLFYFSGLLIAAFSIPATAIFLAHCWRVHRDEERFRRAFEAVLHRDRDFVEPSTPEEFSDLCLPPQPARPAATSADSPRCPTSLP